MDEIKSIFGSLFVLMMFAPLVRPQDVVLPGSTVEDDSLGCQGQFLKGMAWYELNAARARELDVKTAHELDQWNREVYEAYDRELSASAARRRSVRNERQADAKRRLGERDQRLRTNPTVDDIPSGDARCGTSGRPMQNGASPSASNGCGPSRRSTKSKAAMP